MKSTVPKIQTSGPMIVTSKSTRPLFSEETKKNCLFIVDMMIQNVHSFHRQDFKIRTLLLLIFHTTFVKIFSSTLKNNFSRKKISKQNSVLNYEEVAASPKNVENDVTVMTVKQTKENERRQFAHFAEWICKKHYTQICLTCFNKNVKIN